MKITNEQYDELANEYFCGSSKDFHKKLKEITGIEAIPYTAYQYFYGDNFIGNSEDYSLRELVKNANITVGDEE